MEDMHSFTFGKTSVHIGAEKMQNIQLEFEEECKMYNEQIGAIEKALNARARFRLCLVWQYRRRQIQMPAHNSRFMPKRRVTMMYFSPTGTTERILEKIASGMGHDTWSNPSEEVINCDGRPLEEYFSALTPDAYSFIIIYSYIR